MCNKHSILLYETIIEKPHPPGTLLGCGITAYDLNDALSILNTKVFNGYTKPKVKNIKEDVDIRSLDQNHVIPNMGIVTDRGVWFPLGYLI
jgi:hypothetical protein